MYHVYADAVPAGLTQQVLRFDLLVGEPTAASRDNLQPQRGDVLRSAAGPYTVELDASDLASGKETEVTMRILKDGHPAEDLAPYLGVPAHAVFIAAKDLAYVHAHATAAQPGFDGHAGHGGHGAAGTAGVPSELTLHLSPPQPGTYALWVQFTGGDEVRTVPFVISVAEADAS